MEIRGFEVQDEAVIAFVATVVVVGGGLVLLSGGSTESGFSLPEGANRTSMQFSTVLQGHQRALSATDHYETVTINGENASRTFYLWSDLTSRVALYNSTINDRKIFLNYTEDMAYRNDGSSFELTERARSSFNPSLITLPVQVIPSGINALDQIEFSYEGTEMVDGVRAARYSVSGMQDPAAPLNVTDGFVIVDSESRIRRMELDTGLGSISYRLEMKELDLERPSWAGNRTQ
ncbi:MAG: hypothetical protein ABEK01_02110 [Candidatus Nanohaloarchaea archaeon]